MLLLAEPSTDLVRDRWARAERLGLRREADGYPIGTTDADLSERRDRLDDVLREERELLEPIAEQLGGGPLVAIVADRDGVILSAHADRRHLDPMARVRLVEGARWDETTRGTNAIGTALVEGRAVAVVGDAHFEVRNRDLFCYATPVRDPFGDIVAVLDVTGPLERHHAAIGLAVQSAGVALERALRSSAYGDRRSGALAAIEHLVHRAAGPSILIEANGIARVINPAARDALKLAGESTLTCERLFGVSFDVLLLAAASRDGMRYESRAGEWKVSLDPIAGDANRTLAVIVHFERVTGHAAASSGRTAAARPTPTPPPVAMASAGTTGVTGTTGREIPELAAILGTDRALVEAKERAIRFATTPLPVLLLAETGTGKELFARAIHAVSARRDRSFVAVNCGALSPHLIASELFGYAPGAYTGAARNGSEGRIGAAHGGTLFLDEIAEMPEALQAALLRVLDNGTYQRVGEARERRADFRLICATCRDLPARVASGTFRNDLFYRIQGATVTIPQLRQRTDVVWLGERLLAQIAAASAAQEDRSPFPRTAPQPELAADARAFVEAHAWPGNVRELKSAMAHAIALAGGERCIRREHLPAVEPVRVHPIPARLEAPVDVVVPETAEQRTRNRIVRDAIETTLRACAGNVSEAARRLGVGRGTIYRALGRTKAD